MYDITQLRRIADEGMSGLEAGDEMWSRIHQKVEAPKAFPLKRWAWVPALCAAAAVLVLLLQGGIVSRQWNTGSNFTAGDGNVSAGSGNPVAVSITSAPSGEETNLLLMGGKAYTLTGDKASSGQLGSSLGAVSEYTLQPSLSSNEVVSSVVPAGEEIYSIKEAPGLVAAQVNGEWCLFQRSSALGKGPAKGERLSDTLCDAGNVDCITCGEKSLSGEEAREALSSLYSSAEEISEKLSDGNPVTILTKGGLKLTLTMKNGCVAACGTWYCPDFCSLFE